MLRIFLSPRSLLIMGFFLLCISSDVLFATPLPAEKKLTLKIGDIEFSAFFLPSMHPRKTYGGIIFLPERSGDPNRRYVITPLRQRLPRYGWATLSIALPEYKMGEEEKTFERIHAAIEYFEQQEIKRIVLLSYGANAYSAFQFTQQQKTPALKGLVFVSAIFPAKEKMDKKKKETEENANEKTTTFDMGKLSIPLFDIYASHDYQQVIQAAQQRRFLYRGKKPPYMSYQVLGADHWYVHFEDDVAKHIRYWLKQFV